MKKVLDGLKIIGVIAFVLIGYYLYCVTPIYSSPKEPMKYLWCDGDEVNSRVITLTPDNGMILEKTYCDVYESAYAAERISFSIHGELGKKLLGQYYLMGESIFGIRKAPKDTRPAFVKLKCEDYDSYNLQSPISDAVGRKSQSTIYFSDDYLIFDDIEFKRISEEELPWYVLMPLLYMDYSSD